jgi:hypothetical protein
VEMIGDVSYLLEQSVQGVAHHPPEPLVSI